MAKRKAVGIRAEQRIAGKSGSEHARELDSRITADESALRLGPIELVDPFELVPSPVNHVFDSCKSSEYIEQLTRDITEAGGILEPVLIFADREIASGHSRVAIAKELAESDDRFRRIPARVIGAELSREERDRRVLLANLSRFEIDRNTRLRLLARVYPDYFEAEAKPGKRDTVSRKKAAQTASVSERHIARERTVYQEARKRAGGREPDDAQIAGARREINKRRRERKPEPVQFWEAEPVDEPVHKGRRVDDEALNRIIHPRRSETMDPLSRAIAQAIANAEGKSSDYLRGILAVLDNAPIRDRTVLRNRVSRMLAEGPSEAAEIATDMLDEGDQIRLDTWSDVHAWARIVLDLAHGMDHDAPSERLQEIRDLIEPLARALIEFAVSGYSESTL